MLKISRFAKHGGARPGGPGVWLGDFAGRSSPEEESGFPSGLDSLWLVAWIFGLDYWTRGKSNFLRSQQQPRIGG